MLYFLTTLRSSVERATRSRSGDGPTMGPASDRMAQSFFLALSAWTGMKWLGTFRRKRPMAVLDHSHAPFETILRVASRAARSIARPPRGRTSQAVSRGVFSLLHHILARMLSII